MLNIDFTTKATAAGGSFWQKHLSRSQVPLSNHMALMAESCGVMNGLRTGAGGWVNEQTRTVGPLVLDQSDLLLITLGGAMTEWQPKTPGVGVWQASRKTSSGWRAIGMGDTAGNPLTGSDLVPLLSEYSSEDAPHRNSQPVYLLLVPGNYTLLTLVAGGRLLYAGIDFETRPGVAIFRQHPEIWLTGSKLVVKLALDSGPSTSDYVLSADVYSSKAVSDYYRFRATPGTLLAASCAAAGLIPVQKDCTVSAVIDKPTDGCVYVMAGGEHIDVPYDHLQLEAGQQLSAGTFIGASPSILNTKGSWWLTANWGTGVDLSKFTPWNLFAPNSLVNATGNLAGGMLRTRIHLQGADTELARWWAACDVGEDARIQVAAVTLNAKSLVFNARAVTFDSSGTTLAGILGLKNGKRVTINPLHVFSQYVWTQTAMVVDLGAFGLDEKLRARMSSFLHRERPLGKLALVLDP